MTRETKIGLLVGLAFIIVIGILLSDHLTQTNEPQQAQLAQVAGNVRTGVAVPGGPQAPAANSGAATPPSTQAVTPHQTVPTKEELTPTKPPVEIVQIGGAPASSHPQTPAKPQADAEQPAAEQGVASVDSNSPPVARTPTDRSTGSLANVAHTMGEDIVSLEHPTAKNDAPASPQKPLAVAALPAGSKQYKAEAGDSVSKMASKLMGGNTKANRDALVAANPSLQQNANMVIVGRTYVIPGGSAPTTVAQQPAPPAKPQAETPAAAPTQVAASTPQYFYTVKAGDSLTKIAVMQLGNADAVPAIMDLNKDTLKGKDVIRPNMKLRLPAKPIASAE